MSRFLSDGFLSNVEVFVMATGINNEHLVEIAEGLTLERLAEIQASYATGSTAWLCVESLRGDYVPPNLYVNSILRELIAGDQAAGMLPIVSPSSEE